MSELTAAGEKNIRALATGVPPPEPTEIAALVDALDDATFTGDTLTTSDTPTVDELEACVGALAGKVNEIIAILKANGFAVTPAA